MRNPRVTFVVAITLGLVAASCGAAPVGYDDRSSEVPLTTVVATTSDTIAATTTTSSTTSQAPPSTTEPAPTEESPAVAPRADIEAFSSSFQAQAGPGERVQVAAFTVDGDYEMVDSRTGAPRILYNAATLRREAVSGTLVKVWDGVVAGGPDFSDPFLRQQGQAQTLVARALEAGTAEQVEIGGRPSVQVRFSVEDSFSGVTTVDEIAVAVDTETGLVTRWIVDRVAGADEHYEPYESTGDVRTGLVVDESRFFTERGSADDGGFAVVGSVDEASKLAGYGVPVPAWIPDGYRLSQVAFGAAPVSGTVAQNVVVMTFRKAAWRIDVTIRDASPVKEWVNPYDPDDYQGWSSEQVGAFTVVAGDITHAWAVIDDQVITVAGGLGIEDIKKIVSSFD